MPLRKKPLIISELIKDLEAVKDEQGDCEVWMCSKQIGQTGDSIELDSVGTVSMFKVAQNNQTGVMLIAGQDYLKL